MSEIPRLFPERSNLQVARLAQGGALQESSHTASLEELILSCRRSYPKIGVWFQERVVPGIKVGQRVGYVGYENDMPTISAILKRDRKTKFCHLRIGEAFQDEKIGELFFALMALEVRHVAEEIHFTLPESLWERKQGFFSSFGFCEASVAETQYRLYERELHCAAEYSQVWEAVLTKLPLLVNKFDLNEHTMLPRLVLSLRLPYAEAILNGSKAIEVRKRFSKRWEGHRIALYATAPDQALVGEATISRVDQGRPQQIWEEYETKVAASKVEYDAYVGHAKTVFAIEIGDPLPYRHPVPLTQMWHLLGEDIVAPQSYCDVAKSPQWTRAVSLSALLRGVLHARNMGGVDVAERIRLL